MSRFIRVITLALLVGTLSAVCFRPAAPTAAQAAPPSDLASILASIANAPPAQETAPEQPVVRAFMFTRAGCLHCDEARHEILPPVQDMFGSQLDLRFVYGDTKMGKTLFQIAVVHYGIDDPGVPLLLVGDQQFQGTQEIRDLFPSAVLGYLSQGGVDWPDMPGLEYAIAEAGEPEDAATVEPSPTDQPAPTVTVQPTATVPPTPTQPPAPSPTPTPTPSSRFSGCFGSIALGFFALGIVVVPRVRARHGAMLP